MPIRTDGVKFLFLLESNFTFDKFYIGRTSVCVIVRPDSSMKGGPFYLNSSSRNNL